MRRFWEPVDLRSRKEMTHYLEHHFRYYTMNSWNGVESYACNLKIFGLGLSSEIESKLFDLLDHQEFYAIRQSMLQEFNRAHNYRWQAGMNGRSGGYLVLYEGQLQPTGYLSFCTACGQQNGKSVLVSGNVCGKCKRPTRIDHTAPQMKAIVFPGRGLDMDEDFSEWSITDLRDRVQLVQELDQLADDMVAEAVYLASHYDVVEEEVYIPQTRKALVMSC